MDRFIGLDTHLSSCTLAIVGPSGKRLRSEVIETSAGELARAVRRVRGTRHLCLEEGTMSDWLHEVLSPHVHELVVIGPQKKKRGPKSDRLDAFDLANKLRLGDIEHSVFKGHGPFKRLRELSRVYQMVNDDVVRVKNRLKSMYRSRGIATGGKEVFRSAHRQDWLKKLPPQLQAAAQTLHTECELLESLKKEAQKELIEESHRHAISRVLETVPGMGEVRVAQAMAIVVTPQRFRTKRQFWSYSGLGIVMRSSSDYVQEDGRWVRAPVMVTRGLSPRSNHDLKRIFKGAATTVGTVLPRSPLGQSYAAQLANGTKPNLAKLTLARKIAAIFLAMWKKKEEYDPERYR
jgi:transposase